MARKTVEITISAEGRDKDKTFRITEMPALQAERWATRLLFILAKMGVTLPQEVVTGGMASVQALISAGMPLLYLGDEQKAVPLLDELMNCVEVVEPSVIRKRTADDIEEIGTFFLLRGEALKLHIDFFENDAPLKSTSDEQTSSSSTIPISPEQSPGWSRPAKHPGQTAPKN